MSKKLEGKVAIVTGSGQGVGRGIAIGLAREGVKVVTNNRKPASQKKQDDREYLTDADRKKLQTLKGDAESTANSIIEEGGEAVPFYGDISSFDTAAKLVEAAMDAFGRVDIIVNNAAGLNAGSLTQLSEEDFDYVTVAKLKGSFNLMRHAVPVMIEQKFGRVINVASYAWMGLAGLSAYSLANAGIVGLTKATAKELYPAGITVNAICPEAESPGHVLEFSNMKNKLSQVGIEIPEEKLKEIADAHGPAENLAPFVAYLSTEEASYISGAVFAVTGSGRVNYFTESVMVQDGIEKSGSPWTIDELIKITPEKLLKGYRSTALQNEHATMLKDIS